MRAVVFFQSAHSVKADPDLAPNDVHVNRYPAYL